ncbi:hypothetical protein SLEP1_g43771 [Rubroshorea leprosula]|uniref:Uncharacterized protein n=1 Tax=Rubroshorea leprosula TaxID=152421 RepID=A0AAV5LE26_9ROSI|nr:hypothetical protein SLEP1_g43771 [Rubroshorea leprosula]
MDPTPPMKEDKRTDSKPQELIRGLVQVMPGQINPTPRRQILNPHSPSTSLLLLQLRRQQQFFF